MRRGAQGLGRADVRGAHARRERRDGHACAGARDPAEQRLGQDDAGQDQDAQLRALRRCGPVRAR
eukprot:7297972-Alexandrium_andersonii.AAC.1